MTGLCITHPGATCLYTHTRDSFLILENEWMTYIHVQSYTGVYTVHIHTYIYMWYIHVCVNGTRYGTTYYTVHYSLVSNFIPSLQVYRCVTYIEYKLVVPTCTGSSSLQYLYPVPVICNTCTSNGAVQEGNACFLLGEWWAEDEMLFFQVHFLSA
jgi:hypothetical protein